MNTVSYTLNKTVFVLDKDTGALKSLAGNIWLLCRPNR